MGSKLSLNRDALARVALFLAVILFVGLVPRKVFAGSDPGDDVIGTGVVVNTKKLVVRERPTRRAPEVGELFEGERVDVLLVKGRAAKIRTPDGSIGWVPAKYLDIQENQSPPPGEETSGPATEETSPMPGGTSQENSQGELPRIYIVPLKAEDVDPELGAAVQGAIYEGFEKRHMYKFMTKADVENELGKGGAAQFFGCGSDVSCLCSFAKDLGLSHIYTTKLYRTGDALVFKMNEIDPSIGAINNSAHKELDEEGDVFTGVSDVITKLLGVGEDGAKVLDLSGDMGESLSLNVKGNASGETNQVNSAEEPENGAEASSPGESVQYSDRLVKIGKKNKNKKKENISQAWAWIVLGAGVAVAATGSAFYFMANKNVDNYKGTPFQVNDPTYHEQLRDTIDRQALLGNILVPIGGAIAASSSVLFWLAFSGREEKKEKEEKKRHEWSLLDKGGIRDLRLFAVPTLDGGVIFGAGFRH
ncbi:MAG: SH3 domain-containing protein [Deltaproteobacteria bacterium]|nr:SH3 domain-containing protein [Deltaproteobacteria bacterium]